MDVRIELTTNKIEKLPQLYWLKHDPERGSIWRTKVPEVFPVSDQTVRLTKYWQYFTYYLNPGMTGSKWRVLYGYYTAFTNQGAGYDRPGDPPKQDWINIRDLTAIDVPRFPKIILCGGALLAGIESNGFLWIDYIDANLAPPEAKNVPIWKKFCALNIVDRDTFSRFPQGDGRDVWIPILGKEPIGIPLTNLIKLDMNKPLPSPYTLFKQ